MTQCKTAVSPMDGSNNTLSLPYMKWFSSWKICIFWLQLYRGFFEMTYWKWVSIGSDNGLAPSWCQAITWTNVDKVSWQHIASLDHNELSVTCISIKGAPLKCPTRCCLLAIQCYTNANAHSCLCMTWFVGSLLWVHKTEQAYVCGELMLTLQLLVLSELDTLVNQKLQGSFCVYAKPMRDDFTM